MTEEFFIFAKWNEDASKRWEIIIPLDSVLIDQWSVKGESRRKQIVGGSTAVTGNVAFGGGTIQEGGQRQLRLSTMRVQAGRSMDHRTTLQGRKGYNNCPRYFPRHYLGNNEEERYPKRHP